MKRKPAIIVPELKGSPILFTKNISDALKNLSVMGSSNLNINSLNKLTNLINDIGTKKLPKLENFDKALKLIRNKDFNQLNFLHTIKDTFTTKDFLNFQNELAMLILILKKKK